MAKRPLHGNPSGCYVYEILVDGIVRYVGKGTGRRAQSHIAIARSVMRRRVAGEVVKTQKFYNQLAKALNRGAVVTHRVLADQLTTEAAFTLEIETIASHQGLWNRLPGGQGADSAHFKAIWASEEGRAKYLAYSQSDEGRAKARARAALQWADPEARARNSARTKAQWDDPDTRTRQTDALRASRTEESRASAAEKQRKIWQDKEYRSAQSERIKAALAASPKAAGRSDKSKAMWSKLTPDERIAFGRRISEGQRASPAVKASAKARSSSGEMSRRTEESWRDPIIRQRRIEAINQYWQRRRGLACST